MWSGKCRHIKGKKENTSTSNRNSQTRTHGHRVSPSISLEIDTSKPSYDKQNSEDIQIIWCKKGKINETHELDKKFI